MLLAQAERRLGIAERLAAVIPDGRDPSRVAHPLRRHPARAHPRHRLRLRGRATTSTACAPIRPSSWPAGGCPTAGVTCARSRPCRAGRTRPSLRERDPADGRSWSICTAPATPTPPAAVTLDIDDTGRRGARPPAAVAVQRPLRRALLPADPCLRHRHRPPGGDDPAPRQDAVGQGGARPSAPPGPPHPPPLAGDPHHHPRRRPLRPAGGDGLVRGQRRRLHLRPARQRRARPPRSTRPPTTSAPAGRSRPEALPCAVSPRPATAPSPGRRSAARAPASRPRTRASTSASSSPTSQTGSAEHVYDDLYCARGQAENLIKLHKGQLASDRTSCRTPLANQMRLILHTAAYWLILTVRDAIPKTHALASAEFATLRLRLLKIGARVIETAARSASPSPPPVPTPHCSANSASRWTPAAP